MRQHWDEANAAFPTNTIVRMVDSVRLLTDETVAADVQAFFAEHPIAQAAKTLEQVLERQRVNAALRARETERFAAALALTPAGAVSRLREWTRPPTPVSRPATGAPCGRPPSTDRTRSDAARDSRTRPGTANARVEDPGVRHVELRGIEPLASTVRLLRSTN